MSQENVEVVRRLIEHWEQGDWRWGRDVFDEECEAVFSASWFPEADNYRVGVEALRAWTGFTEAFETFEVQLDRIIDAGVSGRRAHSHSGSGPSQRRAVDAFTGVSSRWEAAGSFGMC